MDDEMPYSITPCIRVLISELKELEQERSDCKARLACENSVTVIRALHARVDFLDYSISMWQRFVAIEGSVRCRCGDCL